MPTKPGLILRQETSKVHEPLHNRRACPSYNIADDLSCVTGEETVRPSALHNCLRLHDDNRTEAIVAAKALVFMFLTVTPGSDKTCFGADRGWPSRAVIDYRLGLIRRGSFTRAVLTDDDLMAGFSCARMLDSLLRLTGAHNVRHVMLKRPLRKCLPQRPL